MTTSRNFVIYCNGCHEEDTWGISVLRHTKERDLIKNAGYTTEAGETFLDGRKHYCPDCNDREKDEFHVYDGYGEEYLGTVEAWGIIHARRVAHDEKTPEADTREVMVKRERKEVVA